jgi:hypothetical protein
LDGRLQDPVMSIARDAIEHDSGKTQLRVEALEAFDHRGDAARAPGCVEHENYGQIEQLCNLRSAALIRFAGLSVEQSHHAFDDGYVRAEARTLEELAIGFGGEHPCVEIAGGASADCGVVLCVEEVRPALEGLDDVSKFTKGCHESKRYGRLAYAAAGSGDQEGNHDRPSIFAFST